MPVLGIAMFEQGANEPKQHTNNTGERQANMVRATWKLVESDENERKHVPGNRTDVIRRSIRNEINVCSFRKKKCNSCII